MNINQQRHQFNYEEETNNGWNAEKISYVLFFAFFAIGIISKFIIF